MVGVIYRVVTAEGPLPEVGDIILRQIQGEFAEIPPGWTLVESDEIKPRPDDEIETEPWNET